jgi:hypothetical protein
MPAFMIFYLNLKYPLHIYKIPLQINGDKPGFSHPETGGFEAELEQNGISH